MNCCIECFSDPQIQAMISANGKYGNCDFCKKTNVLIFTVIDNWNIFRKDSPSSYDLVAAFCSTVYGDDEKNHNKNVCIPRSYADEYGIFSGHTWR